MRKISPNQKRKCKEFLDTKKNVVGFSGEIQKKEIKGKKTETNCVKIYVEKKVPL